MWSCAFRQSVSSSCFAPVQIVVVYPPLFSSINAIDYNMHLTSFICNSHASDRNMKLIDLCLHHLKMITAQIVDPRILNNGIIIACRVWLATSCCSCFRLTLKIWHRAMSFEAKKVSYKISTPDFMTRTVHSIREHTDLDQQHMMIMVTMLYTLMPNLK